MRGGQKNGTAEGKPAMAYIPALALLEVGKAFTHGEKKYGKLNYMKGLFVLELLAGSVRHIFQFIGGEDKDADSGVNHLGCAGANLLMALEMFIRKPQLDDRYKEDNNLNTISSLPSEAPGMQYEFSGNAKPPGTEHKGAIKSPLEAVMTAFALMTNASKKEGDK